MAIEKKKPYELPTYGVPAALPGLGAAPAAPVPRSGATGFSAQGAAKPVATGVNTNPAPVLARPAAAEPAGPQAGVAQRIGENTRWAAATTLSGANKLNPLAIGARGFANALPAASKAVSDAAYGFTHPGAGPRPDFGNVAAVTSRSPGANAPAARAVGAVNTPPAQATAAAPVRNPVVSTVGGGGSTPAGGVPASSSRPVQVNAGPTPQAYTTGDGRSGLLPPGVAVVRQKDGTNAFAATGASVAQATGQPATVAPVARPAVGPIAAPSIAPVSTPAVNGASESRETREARQTALSNLDSLQFQLRGKTTRGARDAMTDIERTRAGLLNTGAQVGGELVGGNRDAASRAGIAALEAQSANDRTVASETGANARSFSSEEGQNYRAGLELQRPTFTTDAEGNYLAVRPDGTASNVTNAGKPVQAPKTKAEGAITPQVQLESLTKELEAASASLQPDPQRIGALQAQIDAIRTGNSGAGQAASDGQTATNPETGERVRFNAKTGKWEPMT